MTNNASGKAAQDRTILHASNRGLTWTDDEIAFLTDEANANETDEAIAYAIGRTLYAVWAMRYTLRHGGRDAVERMRTAHATVSRVDRVCDTCYLTRPACGCED